MGNLKSIPLEEQVQILRQEVAVLNKEIINLHKFNEKQLNLISELVSVTKDSYLQLNDEITRVAKLRTEINTSLS